jgi:hypothetical protein
MSVICIGQAGLNKSVGKKKVLEKSQFWKKASSGKESAQRRQGSSGDRQVMEKSLIKGNKSAQGKQV